MLRLTIVDGSLVKEFGKLLSIKCRRGDDETEIWSGSYDILNVSFCRTVVSNGTHLDQAE
jgi:hypothetical protein